VVIGILGVEFQ